MNTIPDDVVSYTPRIPPETWEQIFWKLSSLGDLYNLSLTSRYIHNIVRPILYSRLSLDLNHYSTYTLALLRHDPILARRIQHLTLLPSINRNVPAVIRMESETLYRTLDIPNASNVHITQFLTPVALVGQLPELPTEVEKCIRPIFHFFPLFTGLTSLRIVNDCVPNDFFPWIYELPQLTTLYIRDCIIAMELQEKHHPTPLPLRTLSILRCWTRPDLAESYIPGKICDGLLKYSPLLTSLTVDLFAERAACLVLADMDHPPPIQSLSCHGLGARDPTCTLFCAMLLNLPTITTLSMSHSPRELGPALSVRCLPRLRILTGQLRTHGFFLGAHRPLEYLTITDFPTVPGGSTPWETQLISFFETLWKHGTDLKGLKFDLNTWSDDVFLCVCQLWPGLKELRIRCAGPGVDEYFRISFGPRFLPQFQNLEALHIYQNESQHNSIMPKGVFVDRHNQFLSPEAVEELAEAPIHYRRWEKICPSLREVAFDRYIWWRRLSSERGGWILMRRDLEKE